MTTAYSVTPLGMTAGSRRRKTAPVADVEEILVNSANYDRYSLAFMEAQEISTAKPEALVICRHPQNGDIAFRAGIALPDNQFDRDDEDTPLCIAITDAGRAAAYAV